MLGRRLRVSLGTLGIVALGACLVFDGRTATEPNDGGREDGAQSEGRATDAAADQQAMESGTEGGGSRLPCGPGTMCAGGPGGSCCALTDKSSGGWTWAGCCDAATIDRNFQYECDDDTDCDAGLVCCASPPVRLARAYPQSRCREAPCLPKDAHLCQPSLSDCGAGSACVDSGAEYNLPPGYGHCSN
jgi:hypothetical protein